MGAGLVRCREQNSEPKGLKPAEYQHFSHSFHCFLALTVSRSLVSCWDVVLLFGIGWLDHKPIHILFCNNNHHHHHPVILF